jgi:hypothetical protein
LALVERGIGPAQQAQWVARPMVLYRSGADRRKKE